MKALKFMLAAATAIGLTTASQATDYDGSTDFESFTVGATVNSTMDSLFQFAGAEGDNESVIDNVVTSYSGTRPRMYANDSASAKYLKVSTGTEPLLRKFDSSATVQVPGGGIYIDTLVQFTVTPSTDDVTTNAADKLLIYLKDNGAGATNLYVKAAFYQPEDVGTAVEEDLHAVDVAVSSSVVPGQWYRLTVQSSVVQTINDDDLLVFKIWLDGNQLSVPAATGALYDQDLTVFPSLLGKGTANARLAAVGFAGEGCVDDLAITTEDPLATAYDFTFTLGTGITGVNFTIDGTDYTPTENGSYKVYEGQTITVGTIGYDTGYMAGTTTASGLTGDGPYTVGTANCSLAFTAGVLPTVSTAGGATATYANGVYTFAAPAGSVIASLIVNGSPVAAAEGSTSYDWAAVAAATVSVTAAKAAAAHPWYEKPGAFALAENLPGQTGNIVSAFHGQGEGEYLGLTYSTNPLQFDLFEVDGTQALVTNRSVAVGDVATAGFRGVAISKTLGIAMTLSYSAGNDKMYVFPLVGGGNGTAVTLSDSIAFDSAAFSPDGRYLFSNSITSPNTSYYKWEVSNGGTTLTKVGTVTASGRGRNLAYARINGRDLVFALVDTGKVAVLDMTGDTPGNWTATDMITDLPAHSYGSLCVSGVNVYPAAPKLTVATSTNNGATKTDVLNVYALTVPASGAVTQVLVKSFDEDAMTSSGFGDISDANRYGNTVYVTDDEKTIYFGRPDNKLYVAQYGEARIGNTIYETLKDAVDTADTGATVYVLRDCSVTNGNTGVTFTKGINLVNDRVITIDGANYALRIANGTTTPVTMSGTGSLVWAKGSGSPILVGCNEIKSGYGINSFYEGSFVLNGGYLTSTYATAKGGNLVKLEAGTFVLNDGTINGGTRGVKADSEGNNATCVLTINGGTIVNTNSAAIAASTAGSGSSTVVVNGGTFTGAITGAGMVTIPGLVSGVANTAKFDRDQSTFCESGYETTLDNGWYVVTAVAPSGEDVAPGQQSVATYDSQAAAEAAIANVTIVAPEDVATNAAFTAEAKTAYLEKFEKKVVSAGEGQYKVEVALTAAAAAALQTEVDADAAEVVEDLSEATVTLTTTPGFYYSFLYGTSLSNMQPTGTPTLATGETLTLTRPTTANATSGFFKVVVTVTP